MEDSIIFSGEILAPSLKLGLVRELLWVGVSGLLNELVCDFMEAGKKVKMPAINTYLIKSTAVPFDSAGL